LGDEAAEFEEAVGGDARSGACDRDGREGVSVSVENGRGDAVNTFEVFALVEGEAVLSDLFQAAFEGLAGGKGVRGVSLKGELGEDLRAARIGEEGEDGLAGGAAVRGGAGAKIDDVFECVRGGKLVEEDALGICEAAELGGFAGGLEDAAHGVACSVGEALGGRLRLSDEEEPRGQGEALGAFVAAEIAEFFEGAGEPED
jgi:hypothetical protein